MSSPRVCDRTGCEGRVVARGMCRKHYMAWNRATPKEQRTPAPRLSRLNPAERFHAKVVQGEADQCWPFVGARHASGHGQFFVSKERGRLSAHAFALELATGSPCPPGMETCHRCDNPPCCNPAHLYFGTRKQNVDDMWRRDRGPRGVRHVNARLNDTSVVAIRTRFAEGDTQTALAAEFGLNAAYISDIVNGRTWKHVGGPTKTHGRPGRRPRKVTA